MKHKITILFIALIFLFLGNFQPLFCMSLSVDNQLNINVSQKPELNEIAAYDSIMLAQLKFAQTKSAQSAIKIDMLTKEKAFYQNQNKKLLSLINNYDDQNFIFLSIGFVIISLMAFVVFILWRERFRYKQQSMVLASLEAENNLSQSQDLFLKDQNLQLNEVIISKERELTALTMQLANIQDSISLLVDKASLELKENKEFVRFVNTGFDLQRDGKIFFEDRYPIAHFLSSYTDVVLSHQWGNDLNYAYLDAMYYGYPLVHNAYYIQDAGYHYEFFDYEKGAQQLKKALSEHDDNLEEYKERNRLEKVEG